MKNDNNTLDNLLNMLLVLFVGLKLGGVIDWSWWAVTAPFWLPFAIGITIGFVTAFVKAKRRPTAAERAEREGRGATH